MNNTTKIEVDYIDGERYEAPYVNGIIHGELKSFHRCGDLFEKTPYINGEREGVSSLYYLKSSRNRLYTFKKNIRHGASIRFRY